MPGVDKVGPKTAAKWIAQYGSLDEVMARSGEIGGMAGENLRKARDWLPRARELLTIKCDVALPEKVADLAARPADTARLAELFERFELKALRRDFEGGGSSAEGRGKGEDRAGHEPGPGDEPAARVPSCASRRASRAATRPYLPRRSSTRGSQSSRTRSLPRSTPRPRSLDPMQARLVGLSFAIEPGQAAYMPVAHRYAGAPAQLPVERCSRG